jgi:multiple sugar transport system ATP-binding protein
MAEIEYRGLTKIFPDGTVAVEEFDLVLPDGEFLVLVGPSGSGKSTVLRMTAGLEDVSRGEILIGGEQVNHLAPQDRNIAMVFQNYALYPHMTVRENMGFGLKLHKHPKAEIRERVDEAAHMLGINDLLKKKPGQLSGGQRQRVAMGRAIVREPDAFLMDEPLSNLDAKLRVEMRAYIAMLHQRLKTTTLYVTHDQVEAMTMGDRVAVMRRGHIEQVDVPQVLYDHPANLFVGGFIGSPAMNVVRSRLVAENGGVYTQLGSSRLKLPDAVLSKRPHLREYFDRDVILGIRPEDIEDAALTPGLNGNASFEAHIALAEAMGAEVVAHFPISAEEAVTSESLADLHATDEAAGMRDQLVSAAGKGEAVMTARLGARTKARTGDTLKLAVDVEHLHFFDVETEQSIW